MRVATVLGARPQFIKAMPVSRALRREGHTEFIIHTGQHYDHEMSGIFFEELDLDPPYRNLAVGSGSHGHQTGETLLRLEEALTGLSPDWVLVYGDTNSTLAAALSAAQIGIPLAHVEAGLRSFNRGMPEELNRIVTDHCATRLFCPTETAIANLRREGITEGVAFTGDTMYDAVLLFGEMARLKSTILGSLGLRKKQFCLATIHRAYNTDLAENLIRIVSALQQLDLPVVFPVHPRTRQRLRDFFGASFDCQRGNLRMIDPLGYLDMLMLEQSARLVFTDSGGMQKEAYFLGVPCITLRPETEWVETVGSGWNVLAGAIPANILEAAAKTDWPHDKPALLFGDGKAAERIVDELSNASRNHTASAC
jgi:UDP-GlcNAc3NAcA epimerase